LENIPQNPKAFLQKKDAREVSIESNSQHLVLLKIIAKKVWRISSQKPKSIFTRKIVRRLHSIRTTCVASVAYSVS
jgi:hypothetical protein